MTTCALDIKGTRAGHQPNQGDTISRLHVAATPPAATVAAVAVIAPAPWLLFPPMHTMSTGEQSFREDEAKKRLNNLLKNIIEPALEKIPANLSNQIEIRAWSVEGDEIHQLVDCVMLGPYSAADMHSTF